MRVQSWSYRMLAWSRLDIRCSRPPPRRGRALPYFAHHDSVSALWSDKWRKVCSADVFPFNDGDIEDFTFGLIESGLAEPGIARTATYKLLAINGMEVSVFPIEDSLIVDAQGDQKDLVVRGDRGHRGNLGAEDGLDRWIDDALVGTP